MGAWNIIAGEYPPGGGGVAAYTRTVARALFEAGDAVTVIAPGAPVRDVDAGVEVRRLPRGFTLAGIRAASDMVRANRGARILLQYVPHAFGWKAMNLPLCVWIAGLDASLDVMFHEVGCDFTWRSIRRNVQACVHSAMARLLCRSADRLFVSTPAWIRLLEERGGARGRVIRSLPIPSSLMDRPGGEAPPRGPWRWRVGHFGIHDGPATALVLRALGALLDAGRDLEVLLIGRGSEEAAAALRSVHPSASGRVTGTGTLRDADAARCIESCDAMVQPYLDGATLRRTSIMAALALGVPVVTNDGMHTERWWREVRPAVLVRTEDLVPAVLDLLSCPEERAAVGACGRAAYLASCSPERIIATLRASPDSPG